MLFRSRKHCSYLNHPVVCDEKYGNRDVNKKYRNNGLNRIFLHSYSLKFNFNGIKDVKSPLAKDLKIFLDSHS